MDNRRVLDKQEVVREGFIPFMGGRPDRDSIIDHDDLLNLRINLNIVATVDEFILLM